MENDGSLPHAGALQKSITANDFIEALIQQGASADAIQGDAEEEEELDWDIDSHGEDNLAGSDGSDGEGRYP
jgi:hypothetical protein